MSTTKANIDLRRVEEFQLTADEEQAVRQLLGNAFSVYPDRTYYKQQPDFRYLGWENGKLIAHMAVEHRTINNAEQLLRIFGVADLCVEREWQHQHIGSQLLSELSLLGQKNGIDFIVLLAAEPELYLKNGFKAVNNICRWLMISSHTTLGVAQRHIEAALMVKALGEKRWRPGVVDFLGTIF
ncbi:MAG TPA: GNAT family N-acetyltransferase [Phaeodactylibacter sp.]|nr:GNAT family N-acetyltransferase [Phaeodactylibacter sp.]